MIREALEFLKSQFVAAASTEFLSPCGANSRLRILLTPGKDDVIQYVIAPAKVSREVRTLESFVDALRLCGANDKSTVYVTLGNIVCHIGDRDRESREPNEDVIMFKFPVHPVLRLLQRWATADNPVHGSQRRDGLSQQQLLTLLRAEFVECVFDPLDLDARLSQVVISSQTEDRKTIERAATSLGKTIAAQVTGTAALPESFGVTLTPTRTMDVLPSTLTFDLNCRPLDGVFDLICRAGQLSTVLADAEQTITRLIDKELQAEGLDVLIVSGSRS